VRTALLAIVLVAVMPTRPGAAQEIPTFSAGVESVYVDAWVGHGATPMAGLTTGDFVVKDDGVPQRVELVDTSKVPLHAVLVLDTSASVAGRPFEALKTAARAFLRGLRPDDRATLLTFSHVCRLRGPLVGDPAVASKALDGVSASGTTALRDAVFTGLKLADPRLGRTVLVVFSDGEDRMSWLSAEAVEGAARETDATIYVVDSRGRSDKLYVADTSLTLSFNASASGSRGPKNSDVNGGRTRSPVFEKHETVPFLRHLTEETGGEVFTAEGSDRLDESFLGALARVKNRYLLRYEPKGVKGAGWHKLEVRLTSKRAEVSARRGYLVAATPEVAATPRAGP
jgi:VWFA-related protein